jgi:hypothetical protein
MSDLQLGSVVIKDGVRLNYILKPSNDIIFTLREIDDKVRTHHLSALGHTVQLDFPSPSR